MEARSIFGCVLAAFALAAHADERAPGRPAPNCTLQSLGDARRHDLREFEGKVVWVDFWASWCGSCAESFPFLDDLDAEFRAQGLQVLGINVDEEPAAARDFLAKHPVEFVQLADASGACPREFGVEGMPASYLIDRHGLIRHEHRGFRPSDAAALRGVVETLLAERAEGRE